ncbi:MAG: hypothetical protein J6R64_06415, partial [Lentisphaeria bacterium]|nr:hypothetical protein [Lentisphaeria bacterium]
MLAGEDVIAAYAVVAVAAGNICRLVAAVIDLAAVQQDDVAAGKKRIGITLQDVGILLHRC